MKKIKHTLPLLPLRGITVFPGMVIHFDVGRPKSIAAVRKAMTGDKTLFLCYQNDINVENPDYDDLAIVGVIAEIHQILNLPDGNIRVLIEGVTRGIIADYRPLENYTEVEVAELFDELNDADEPEITVLMRRVLHIVEDYMELGDRLSPDVVSSLMAVDDPGELADLIMSNFPIKPQSKQEILNILNVKRRLEKLVDILSSELEILSLERDIMGKVQRNLDKNQRDYMLREKLNVIRQELGDEDDADADINKYRKQLEGRTIPAEVSEKLEEEFERMKRTHPNSQEYGVLQNYVETVISLPWGETTEDNLDISNVTNVLDSKHYGLNKVKDRILEYVSVKNLGGNPDNNIICLVGPPGTGKTSIARSLADALGRKYVRISLGGVRNESEIRGHRKTYVGAMSGRIIEAVKKAKSSNPLMLFDEIDKMSHDSVAGDPASAMLEVLDSEQNKNFRDHYLELSFDLSDTLFITTANSLDGIPRPLLDRMDVIEVDSYTLDEKINIAKKFLVPKQRKLHGLTASHLKFNASAYTPLIESYTKEAGVRELERKIATVCRKTAKKITENSESSVSVKSSNLSELLGKPLYHFEKTSTTDLVGVVTGLAWTSVGGDILCIEVNTMPGSGKLEITGNLGDVMKESAKAALSYVRANSLKLGIKTDFYKKTDIHIHVPEGAVPKDGPSAGITMTTALVSALTGRKVDRKVAMTGEVTLRGRVLPIGGLKEKTLAAYRMGIKKIVIPFDNKHDMDDLADIVKENIEFVFAKDMETVLNTALLDYKSDTAQYIENSSAITENAVCRAN